MGILELWNTDPLTSFRCLVHHFGGGGIFPFHTGTDRPNATAHTVGWRAFSFTAPCLLVDVSVCGSLILSVRRF